VPGAGLEPARTLPGPRDFKSAPSHLQQTLAGTKALYQRTFARWYSASLYLAASWFSYSVSYSWSYKENVAEQVPFGGAAGLLQCVP
jgi:heme O synthase-like polyprenyltransferase